MIDRQSDTQTDRQSDSQTDRPTDRQTDSQTVSQSVSQSDRQTDRHTDSHTVRQTDRNGENKPKQDKRWRGTNQKVRVYERERDIEDRVHTSNLLILPYSLILSSPSPIFSSILSHVSNDYSTNDNVCECVCNVHVCVVHVPGLQVSAPLCQTAALMHPLVMTDTTLTPPSFPGGMPKQLVAPATILFSPIREQIGRASCRERV